jgi:putative DNA methylase
MTESSVSSAARAETAPGLAPLSLKDAPAFIEQLFPVGRLSAEAYKERKAGAGQTLTALGSYWKGRKPLILVRAVVLGCLLPATDDPAADLDIFLKLMAMDDAAFGRRFDGSATDFARLFPELAETAASNLHRKWRHDLPLPTLRARAWDAVEAGGLASVKRRGMPVSDAEEFAERYPAFAEELTELVEGRWYWRRDLTLAERQEAISTAFAKLPYAERLATERKTRRSEECEEAELLDDVWPSVNRHLGTHAANVAELVEQLGTARFGRRPRLADTFCGGGSIPFESARMGCDVYASDLNPIAAMLTWGAFNFIGSSEEKRAQNDAAQKRVAAAVDAEITRLGIEHDAEGNRAKAFLYCLETRCPRTGWLVPMAPSWVISKTRNVVAKLVPDLQAKRYHIEIHSGVDAEEMAKAERGTVQGGRLVHPMNPEHTGVEIRIIRGDYRDDDGTPRNRLRLWEKQDFIPHSNDIFQERLYCIQWITRETIGAGRPETFFREVSREDHAREQQINSIVRENLAAWQSAGLVPSMPIKPGEKTNEPIRTRGWTHWHHLFTPRALLLLKIIRENIDSDTWPCLLDSINYSARLCRWETSPKRVASDGTGRQTGGASDNSKDVFSNQALNVFWNFANRSFQQLKDEFAPGYVRSARAMQPELDVHSAAKLNAESDIFVTDPPYADAVVYHEITEFFISWLNEAPPEPFDRWTWDSGREEAIKGTGEEFRRDMVAAYSAMTKHLSDTGFQVVMFTHQDAGVWADLASILWAAGLRVTAAWNIVTETESALKEGNYVQGTVCLVLRKRLGATNARRMEIEAEIEDAVAAQLAHLNALDDAWHERTNAETLYTDGDLTLAAYAAALQVVTAYSSIDRQPLDRDLYRKLGKGETTMLRDLVDYAAQVANSLLVPEGFPRDMWRDLLAAERFYVRMLDMEAKGSAKVADFQNFAKSFAFGGYADLMASTTANAASLAGAADLKGRMLEGEGFGGTQLRQVLFAIWKTMEGKELDPKRGVILLKSEYNTDYWQRRQKLIALARYVAGKTARTRPDESAAAHELAEALTLDRV